ncbi:MAG: hypothetical protein GY950_29805 [bacterium]|nr:hypothetical protein [bacterium]
MATEKKQDRYETPSDGERIGSLYNQWVLDCVICAARAVSQDFSYRPQFYQDVDPKLADQITVLQSESGYKANFPSKEIREMLMKPIFGMSDGRGDGNDVTPFHATRENLVGAAAIFSENALEANFRSLREPIRSAIVPFKTHLDDIKGASLYQTEIRMRKLFTLSAGILRDSKIRVVFGINRVIPEEWPLRSNDPGGAKLMEEISTKLEGFSHGRISSTRFLIMQRIGEKGKKSIMGILDENTDDDDTLDGVTAQLYAWGSDLGLIGGLVPRSNVSR